jgi:hypothetical protein
MAPSLATTNVTPFVPSIRNVPRSELYEIRAPGSRNALYASVIRTPRCIIRSPKCVLGSIRCCGRDGGGGGATCRGGGRRGGGADAGGPPLAAMLDQEGRGGGAATGGSTVTMCGVAGLRYGLG